MNIYLGVSRVELGEHIKFALYAFYIYISGVHIIPFSIPFGIDKFEFEWGKFLKWGQIVLKG